MPFCARRCDYCDFFIVTGAGEEGQRDFFAWLRQDLRGAAVGLGAADGLGAAPRVDSIYLGGGTPSFSPPTDIASVIAACRNLFVVTEDAEVTLEANPESVTADRVAQWRAAGVNRLSLGVQSFDDRVLAPRGRLHSAADAETAARTVREGGVPQLGIDLIAGLPGETPGGFRSGIERALALMPSHVSVYLIETDDALKETRLTREVRAGRERLAGEDETVEMYETAVGLLTGAGYTHYEISNFARPGHESIHNLKYWMGGDYLGVGPSAHSSIGGRRFGRPADLARWQAWVASSSPVPPGADYTLDDPEERALEALVLELRLINGVSIERFGARWGYDPASRRADRIASLVDDRLVVCEKGVLRLTPRGILMANDVFARLT